MAEEIASNGYYWGYSTTLVITHNGNRLTLSEKNNVPINYDIPSDDGGSPATCTVTLFNLSKTHLAKINQNDHIIVYSGPTDLYGKLTEGTITQIAPETQSGMDKETQITFEEGRDYSKDKRLYSNFNGSKLVTHTVKASGGKSISYKKRKISKVNITFKKGTKASQIIDRIKREAKIEISAINLKKNHVFKKGYTLSAKPLAAIQAIVKDCGSTVYYRKGALYIDDGVKPNPYNEHLYLTMYHGLTQEPTYNSDDDGKPTWTLECFDDPRVCAGSAVYVKSTNLTGLQRVKSVDHTHDQDSYKMEVVVYA